MSKQHSSTHHKYPGSFMVMFFSTLYSQIFVSRGKCATFEPLCIEASSLLLFPAKDGKPYRWCSYFGWAAKQINTFTKTQKNIERKPGLWYVLHLLLALLISVLKALHKKQQQQLLSSLENHLHMIKKTT